MGLTVEPVDATFGAVVGGIELANLDDDTWQELYGLWLEYALLICPGQFLAKAEQVAFARRFGDLELECAAIANVQRDGTVLSDPHDPTVMSLRGNEEWHHDSTYMPVQAKGAVFSAEIVPSSGGATGWADMRAAYEALDDEMRERVHALDALHSLEYSQGRRNLLPPRRTDGSYGQYGYHDEATPVRPLVKVHPETGRPNLVIGRHAHALSGMTVEESAAFLDDLNAWACQRPRIHHHQWSAGDVVIWDNRRLMHQATPFDLREPRRMWHSRIAGDPATESALNHI